ncbi:MAG: L-lysine 6-transaminase [Acidobacteriota bacterium]|nr:L-lysine 6-transaminase [Acidobacteriota bacterium]
MTVAQTQARVTPEDVRRRLSKHMLVDGLPFVLDLEKSHGAFLYDALGGREIIDLFTCFATSPLGFNHPGLRDPGFVEDILPPALNKPSSADFYTAEMARFVEALAGTMHPSLAGHLFFIEGGALAVENALKTAFDWKVRKNLAAGKGERGYRVIHLREAFHGRSGYTLSLTNTDPNKTDYFPKFDWPRVTSPKLSFPITPQVLEHVEQAETQSIAEIRQALVDHRDDIAALVIEPIQAEGGDNHFRPEYLQALRDLADEEEFLLIFDEVQTGFGTTGKWWCAEHFGVQPDIFAFGKKTQVCGIAASNRIDDVDSVFKVSSRINSTWGGNLVDMVRCRRFVEIIRQESLIENAETVGKRLLDGVGALAEEMPDLVSNPRGRGMFVAFDLPNGDIRSKAVSKMVEEGVLGFASGASGVRFRPPLNLTPEIADEGLRRVRKAILS